MSQKASAHLAPFEIQLRYDVETAAAYLRVSRAHLFKRIKSGDIASIRDGRRLFIPGREIVRLSSLP